MTVEQASEGFWRRYRWAVAGAATGLAAVVGTALVVQAAAAPACAAPPVGGVAHSGKATFYTLTAEGGNCSYPGPPADGLFVALGPSEYGAAAACGGYLDVTGPKGKVRVKVTDQCPECEPGHIDLSAKAFAKIADPVQGIVPVTYRAVVDPPVPGPISFRVKEGASRYWFAVLVDNHANPLSTVEINSGGGAFRKLQRADYNYWLAESGAGAGPFTIRITDVHGYRATAGGVTLTPGKVQKTKVYAGSTAPKSSAASTPTSAKPSPTAAASPTLIPAATPPPAVRDEGAGAGAAPTTVVITPPPPGCG
ncbi:expansin EXLX1 family cellulose-binding protein [Rhizomonospora bruguierae]|uniref:expansin EXLX1 family cellulose-binding protein n=1 Tax=Rhizomonospora bruguierae TaxID=1581705 RepID=UPI0020BDD0D9|nr:expansin EXLX1 family cellulose-binding protein [Micromonospora sp. NBRC 107566]